jgi:molybdopterin molybdotransferase
VNLLPTGSELVAAGSGRAGAKIRDSNSHVVASLLEQSGCRVVRFPITGDDEAELAAAIGRGLAGDMLITIGGVSAGAYDLVPGVLRKLGVEVRFHKLKIKPGGPILFGTRGSTIVFSLPGNPVSAAVTFGQFVAPAIAAMTGASAEPLRLTARLEHDVSKSDGKMHFMRGILGRSGATFTVRSAGAQSSNMISTLAASDCLVVLPEERSKFKTDEEVEVRLL